MSAHLETTMSAAVCSRRGNERSQIGGDPYDCNAWMFKQLSVEHVWIVLFRSWDLGSSWFPWWHQWCCHSYSSFRIYIFPYEISFQSQRSSGLCENRSGMTILIKRAWKCNKSGSFGVSNWQTKEQKGTYQLQWLTRCLCNGVCVCVLCEGRCCDPLPVLYRFLTTPPCQTTASADLTRNLPQSQDPKVEGYLIRKAKQAHLGSSATQRHWSFYISTWASEWSGLSHLWSRTLHIQIAQAVTGVLSRLHKIEISNVFTNWWIPILCNTAGQKLSYWAWRSQADSRLKTNRAWLHFKH